MQYILTEKEYNELKHRATKNPQNILSLTATSLLRPNSTLSEISVQITFDNGSRVNINRDILNEIERILNRQS